MDNTTNIYSPILITLFNHGITPHSMEEMDGEIFNIIIHKTEHGEHITWEEYLFLNNLLEEIS